MFTRLCGSHQLSRRAVSLQNHTSKSSHVHLQIVTDLVKNCLSSQVVPATIAIHPSFLRTKGCLITRVDNGYSSCLSSTRTIHYAKLQLQLRIGECSDRSHNSTHIWSNTTLSSPCRSFRPTIDICGGAIKNSLHCKKSCSVILSRNHSTICQAGYAARPGMHSPSRRMGSYMLPSLAEHIPGQHFGIIHCRTAAAFISARCTTACICKFTCQTAHTAPTCM